MRKTDLFYIILLIGIPVILPGYPGLLYGLDCSGASPLACGEVITSMREGGPGNANAWCFMEALRWPGKEKVFLFELPQTCDVSAVLFEGGYDLDIFLIDECLKEPCIAWGDTDIDVPGLAPGSYYIVLDGSDKEVLYTIQVICSCEIPVFKPVSLLVSLVVFSLALIWFRKIYFK